MSRPRTDRQLTLQALATLFGSQQRDLFQRYRVGVYDACLKQLKEPADAEDTCHEVFVRLFRHLASESYNPATPAQALLALMTKQCIVDVIRRRRRISANHVRDPEKANRVPDRGSCAEALVEDGEYSQLLERLKADLTPAQCRVLEIWLLCGHDSKTSDLARLLKIESSTYRRHQQDIRKRIADLLGFARKRTGSEGQ